ncbi:MAG: spore germination protein GerW family protein [Acutalibacteraceae bacterium]|nr:spore germination protein GerW family protein [Acutalibacteraceae bacterium]
MSENIKDILGVTMDKIKSMATADTIIGDPIVLSDTVTCIPVSKVSYGFASGGSDFGKATPQTKANFGGGGGAGMSVTPVAFLVLQDGNVKILNIGEETSGVEKLVDVLPTAIDKIKSLKKDKKEETTEE